MEKMNAEQTHLGEPQHTSGPTCGPHMTWALQAYEIVCEGNGYNEKLKGFRKFRDA